MMELTQEAVMKAAIQHQDAFVTYAYAMLRDWAAAEDVVQEALMVVMKKWRDFRAGTSIYAWVRRIVRYKTLEAIRARSREFTVEDEQLTNAVETAFSRHLDEDQAAHQKLMMRALEACMAKLSRNAVDLLAGFYRESRSYAELARIFKRSIHAIRKGLYRYRKTLIDCATHELDVLESY